MMQGNIDWIIKSEKSSHHFTLVFASCCTMSLMQTILYKLKADNDQ